MKLTFIDTKANNGSRDQGQDEATYMEIVDNDDYLNPVVQNSQMQGLRACHTGRLVERPENAEMQGLRVCHTGRLAERLENSEMQGLRAYHTGRLAERLENAEMQGLRACYNGRPTADRLVESMYLTLV